MRKIVFLIGIISNLYCQKPDVSGSIEYGAYENLISSGTELKRDPLFNTINKIASTLRFELVFNGNESIFLLEEQMESDLNPLSISFAKNIITKGKYYCNLNDNIFLRESNFYDKYTLIRSKPFIIDWILTKETKKIGGFICYKAITEKVKVNNKGIHTFQVIAWYTPEIPIPFGPNEFNGLPGLILELKDSHFTFIAKRITIDPKRINKEKIKRLNSDNIISENEHMENLKALYVNKN
jgi:GLPGLI family protein